MKDPGSNAVSCPNTFKHLGVGQEPNIYQQFQTGQMNISAATSCVYIYIYIMNTDLCNVGLHLFIVTLLWGQVPRNTYVGSWGSTEVSWRKPWKRWSHWTASAVAKNELVKGRWLWFSKCDTVRYPWLLPSSMVLWKAILSARSPRFSMRLSQGLFFSFLCGKDNFICFNLHTWTPQRCGTKKIFWHEESIVLQLSFFGGIRL